jgi:hypothetical protein
MNILLLNKNENGIFLLCVFDVIDEEEESTNIQQQQQQNK